MRIRRMRTEPPGIWRGQPRLYSRWRNGNQVMVLIEVNRNWSTFGGSSITLQYEDENAYEARRMAQR